MSTRRIHQLRTRLRDQELEMKADRATLLAAVEDLHKRLVLAEAQGKDLENALVCATAGLKQAQARTEAAEAELARWRAAYDKQVENSVAAQAEAERLKQEALVAVGEVAS